MLQTATSGPSPADAYNQVRQAAAQVKATMQGALSQFQAGTGNTTTVYMLLDQFNAMITNFNTWSAVPGLDAYATAQGYTGTLSADIATCISTAQACIAWVVANFPTSGGYLLGNTLNADGSRTPRTFTSAQTTALQSALGNFISSIN